MKYTCIDANREEFPVRMMCRLLDVEPGGAGNRVAQPLRTNASRGRLRKRMPHPTAFMAAPKSAMSYLTRAITSVAIELHA